MKTNAVKSKRNLVEGRSFLLNMLLIISHVFLLFFVFETLLNADAYTLTSKILAIIGLALTTAGLVILKGFYMYSYFARFALALLLIIAGFGKLNDPVGFAEIIRVYLQDGALNVWLAELMSCEWWSLEYYLGKAQSWAITLAIAEILLGLMLLFHMLYKLAVWLVFPLLLVVGLVSWFNFRCDSNSTFDRQIVLEKNDSRANEFLALSLLDPSLTLIDQNTKSFTFNQTFPQICSSDCGCLGVDQVTFFGIHNTPKFALTLLLVGLVFSLILFLTQFQMLPNSIAENTAFGVFAWLFILAHGILTAWFWLVFLSAIVIYLTLNLKRFGIGFLQNAFGSLTVIAALLLGMIYYVISYEPLTDFRPYTIGADLRVYLDDSNEQTLEKIYVYRDKRLQKEIFLREDNHATSMIWEDTNFVFLRMHDFNILSGFGAHLEGFNPLLDVHYLSKHQSVHPYFQAAYEANFEDLVEVRNKNNASVSILRKSEFSSEIERDTNLVFRKFSGVPADVDFVSMQDLIITTDLCYVWIVKKSELLSHEDFQKINELNEELSKNEISFVVLGADNAQKWESITKQRPQDVPFLNLKRSELMKICRSNVCLMVLKKGIVAAKYPLSGLPKYETIASKIK